jgi:hypothetical protein
MWGVFSQEDEAFLIDRATGLPPTATADAANIHPSKEFSFVYQWTKSERNWSSR